MHHHKLREGILWLELLRILTILFAVGFSLGLQVHLLQQIPTEVRHESTR